MSNAAHKRYDYGLDHCYTIRSNPYYGILAGQSGGAQWLITGAEQAILLIKFDLKGKLVETRLLKGDSPEQREEQLEQWKAEVGFTDQPVYVLKFHLEQYYVGVAALPYDGMQEAIDDPDSFAPEELEMIMEEIESWLSKGLFALEWGEEYYMNKDGEVITS